MKSTNETCINSVQDGVVSLRRWAGVSEMLHTHAKWHYATPPRNFGIILLLI